MKSIFYASLILCFSSVSRAQHTTPPQILIPDVLYSPGDTVKAYVYMPGNYKQQKNPVLIFMTTADISKSDHYIKWASFAARNGFAGILYQSGMNRASRDLEKLLDFVSKNSSQFFFDEERVALYGASGPASRALPFANDHKQIKAALIFYGIADMNSFRVDMPVFIVRSGLDNITLNKRMDTMVFRALEANAPYTIHNFNSAVHGFEVGDDTVISEIMQTAIDFLKVSLGKPVQAKFSNRQNEIVAMREMYRGDWRAAVDAFQQALRNNPGDNETERQIGNAYIELEEYQRAIEAYDNSLAHGNWRRGEIAIKKCEAYAALNNYDAAINEMRILKKIGWLDPSLFEPKPVFKNLLNSVAYKNFVGEK